MGAGKASAVECHVLKILDGSAWHLMLHGRKVIPEFGFSFADCLGKQSPTSFFIKSFNCQSFYTSTPPLPTTAPRWSCPLAGKKCNPAQAEHSFGLDTYVLRIRSGKINVYERMTICYSPFASSIPQILFMKQNLVWKPISWLGNPEIPRSWSLCHEVNSNWTTTINYTPVLFKGHSWLSTCTKLSTYPHIFKVFCWTSGTQILKLGRLDRGSLNIDKHVSKSLMVRVVVNRALRHSFVEVRSIISLNNTEFVLLSTHEPAYYDAISSHYMSSAFIMHTTASTGRLQSRSTSIHSDLQQVLSQESIPWIEYRKTVGV